MRVTGGLILCCITSLALILLAVETKYYNKLPGLLAGPAAAAPTTTAPPAAAAAATALGPLGLPCFRVAAGKPRPLSSTNCCLCGLYTNIYIHVAQKEGRRTVKEVRRIVKQEKKNSKGRCEAVVVEILECTVAARMSTPHAPSSRAEC
jgi:hypothetical protein